VVLEGLLVAAGRRGEGTRWRDGVRQNQRHDEAGVCVCVCNLQAYWAMDMVLMVCLSWRLAARDAAVLPSPLG
jgi:hypothetical protein